MRVRPIAIFEGGGLHVTGSYEPRQVREEAAVNKQVWVVMTSISFLRVPMTAQSGFE